MQKTESQILYILQIILNYDNIFIYVTKAYKGYVDKSFYKTFKSN